MSLKVFVGSSVEGLDVAYAVQQNLEHRAEVTVWDQGIFNLSNSALESLVNALSHFDFGIFVFTPEDVVRMRGTENLTVRDNVIFELGLFIGRLGKDRSFILMPRDVNDFHLPTDLVGMSPATYRADRSDRNLRAATGGSSQEMYQAMLALGPVSTNPQNSEAREPSSEAKTLDEQAGESEAETQSDDVKDWAWISAYNGGNYAEAIRLIEKLIKQGNKDDSTKRYLKSMIGRSKAKIDLSSGLEYLRELKEDDPDLAGIYVTIAEVYSENGFPGEALKILDEGLVAAKQKHWLQESKALILNSQGKTDEALDVLKSLIADSPDKETAYVKASQILTGRGKTDEAPKTI